MRRAAEAPGSNISRYEHELLEYGTECLLRVPGLRLIGTAQEKAGVLSFVIGTAVGSP